MNRCVVDTDVVSFLFKNDTRAGLYLPILSKFQPAISFATAAELYRWPIVRNWGNKRIEELEATLAKYIILYADLDVCRQWAGVVSAKAHMAGHQDAWIAATALAYRLPLVTHNRSDYAHIPGLVLL